MPEIKPAIFEIAALLMVIPLSYVLAYTVKYFTASTYEDEVLKLFSFYWNGKPEDELYAWMKVRAVLEKRENADKNIHYVNRKIEEFNKQSLYGSWEVNSEGELLKDRHIQD